MLPHPPHPREVVLELRQLDLELALGAARVLGEDVEDQLRAVDHARLEQVLEPPLLARDELVVDEQRLGVRIRECTLQLVELSLADVRGRIGTHPRLHERRDGIDARRPGQLADLGELLLGIGSLRQHGDDEPTLRFRPGGGIGLASHRTIMTAKGRPEQAAPAVLLLRTLLLFIPVGPAVEESVAQPSRDQPSPFRASIVPDAERSEVCRRPAGRPDTHSRGEVM